MNLSEELQLRGFIGQISADSLAAILDNKVHTVYHGIDPTADSAHVGNFVIWMLLKHLANHGHQIVFLVGGGTGMIGDPKPDAERVLSSTEEVKERSKKIELQAATIFAGQKVEFINNFEWLAKVSLLDFLRDIGKNFTVNELIKKDAIARRLNSEVGLSYTEFAYPLLQAFDYLTLYQNKNCTLQVGGSDQWGNIIAGVDLVRRVERVEVHALTVPLIVDKTTGKKFGKSEGNAVWLSPLKTSPYSFYQFWFNVTDENVIDYLKLFTMLPLAKISEIEKEVATNPGARLAQETLAREVTTIVHGEENALAVEKVSHCLFGEMLVSALSAAEKDLLLASAPVTTVLGDVLVADALLLAGLASSKREARTFIESGAVTINGSKISDINLSLSKNQNGDLVHMKRGKKQVAILALK